MKRKLLWIIPLCCAVLLLTAGIFLSRGVLVGRCVIADNGSVLIADQSGPIQLIGIHERQKQRLSDGDRVLVLCNGIMETYPAKAQIYTAVKLGEGSLSDIPESQQQELMRLGWLEPTQTELPPAKAVDAYETVSYAHGCVNMQLKIPQGWKYEIREYDPESYGFGIDFWPEEVTEGKLSLNYSDAFGVCGTGLEEKTVTLGPYTGWMGTYDGAKIWDFISLQGLPGAYVFQNDAADSWYEDHAGEITAILESAVLAQDMIWEEEALAIGAEALETEQDYLRARFDSTTGMWTVENPGDDDSNQVTIDTKGNVFYRYDLCVDPTAP